MKTLIAERRPVAIARIIKSMQVEQFGSAITDELELRFVRKLSAEVQQ